MLKNIVIKSTYICVRLSQSNKPVSKKNTQLYTVYLRLVAVWMSKLCNVKVSARRAGFHTHEYGRIGQRRPIDRFQKLK